MIREVTGLNFADTVETLQTLENNGGRRAKIVKIRFNKSMNSSGLEKVAQIHSLGSPESQYRIEAKYEKLKNYLFSSTQVSPKMSTHSRVFPKKRSLIIDYPTLQKKEIQKE